MTLIHNPLIHSPLIAGYIDGYMYPPKVKVRTA